MAARKKKTAVAKKGLDALPAALRDRLQSNRFSEREQASGGRMLSVKGRVFRFAGQEYGEDLDVILLDFIYKNVYYGEAYDEDNLVPPDCVAIADDESDLIPLAESPDRQNETCEGCWANEFGSDSRGKGKACNTRRDFAFIIPEFDDSGTVVASSLSAEHIGVLSISPTGVAAWKGYHKRLVKTLKMEYPFQAVTRLSFDESVSAYPRIAFEPVGEIEDGETLAALAELSLEFADDLRKPPDFSASSDDKAKSKRPVKGGKKKPAPKKKRAPRKSKFS